ncbi:shikimate dehydrogenase family protein [Marinoscillum sp.]|uniref:shikimate dehydrogenase family protein n=1 Tax=Marinoscillum sp. TaxID=2024838 RepID=UPI003BA9E813
MKRFGLVGFPLGHSFSRAYFNEKFKRLGLSDHKYDLFEIEYLKDFPSLWDRYPDLVGINVTVPHKENIRRFLDRLDSSAHKVEAVNVIKKEGNKLIGYNSDFFGFKQSVINYFQGDLKVKNALILGGGGASKAVEAGFLDLGIKYMVVSRQKLKGDLTYVDLKNDPTYVQKVDMIVNTTPLGMHPDIDTKPDIPYEAIHAEQYIYDLVYNPEETAFMKEGRLKGARTKNGLEMLHLQADRAWEIWNG